MQWLVLLILVASSDARLDGGATTGESGSQNPDNHLEFLLKRSLNREDLNDSKSAIELGTSHETL